MLAHKFDPDCDYGPWIEQAKRQVAAQRVQHSSSRSLQPRLSVRGCSPRRRSTVGFLPGGGHAWSEASPLMWVEVPNLPDADPGTLARIASEDETVEALRRAVRRAMSVLGSEPSTVAAQELALELQEDAAVLERQIHRERRWKLVVPRGLGLAGLALGAVAGPPLALGAAALGLAAGLAPHVANRAAARANPAYALLLARRPQS
jgi:hypothetical protein